MNEFLREITNGLPDATEFARAVVRLLIAALLGAVVGFERERAGKAAGLRTHMLVALGAALLMLAAAESGMTSSDLSRIIQGVITGIGFLGAGSILKSEEHREIRGLTTAAGIWLTAGVGVAAGLDVNDPVKKNKA
jgi:putative Mg2+ transporter-C (MgtC) family protein